MVSRLAGLLFVFFIFLIVASSYGWLTAVNCWRRGKSLLGCWPRRPVPWGLVDIGLTLICLVVLLASAVQILFRIGGIPAGTAWTRMPVEFRTWMMLAESLVNVAVVVFCLLLIRLRVGATWKDIGVVSALLRADFMLGVFAFIMIAPPVYLLQWMLVQWFESKHPLVELLQQHPNPWTIGVSLFAAVIVAPIAEEFVFRGLLQGWLEKVAMEMHEWKRSFAQPTVSGTGNASAMASDASSHWADGTESIRAEETEVYSERGIVESEERLDAPWNSFHASVETRPPVLLAFDPAACRAVWPILVSSIIFALLHWSHGPDWVPLFFLAVGLGYLYRQTHRIVPGIVVHFLLNAVSMGMFLVELMNRGAAR